MAQGGWGESEENEFNAEFTGEPFRFDISQLFGGEGWPPPGRNAPDESSAPRELHEKEVRVAGVYEQRFSDQISTYFVLVRDNRDRNLRIFIGQNEATSISMAMEGHQTSRPLTHDLARIIIERLGFHVDRVLVDDEYNSIYYAKLILAQRGNGNGVEIDCRPSDAIAIAVRTEAPIYVAEHLMEAEGHRDQEP